MKNNVSLIGNLGADVELEHTGSGTPYVSLSLATNESWMKDGERVTHTEWHKIKVWNTQAENCAKYLKKSSTISVEGRLRTTSYLKNDVKTWRTEIVANRVGFLDKKTRDDVKAMGSGAFVADEEMPFE